MVDVVQPMLVEVKLCERHMVYEPTLALSRESAQTLLQALWDAGLRPNDGLGSGEHVQALSRHIAFAEKVSGELFNQLSRSAEHAKRGKDV
jgi:hypothetical protein